MFNKQIKFLTIIVLFLFISTISFADNLSVNSWIVDSTLIDNGDLDIIKDITYDFKDEFNGVYIDIVLKGTDGIEDIQIFEMVNHVEVPYQLVGNAEKGDKEVFTSNLSKDSLEFKIFAPSKNESKTFRIKYKVKNVAVKHIDTGELYYKFIGDGNETYIDNFSATIKLPSSNREKTKIFAHGPLNGNINFITDDLIKLEASNISNNEFVEARVLFPKDFIKNSSNSGSSNFQSIIDEEFSYIEKLEKDAKKQAKNEGIFNNLSLALGAIMALILGFVFNKLRRDVDIYDELKSLSPEDITPAELRSFYFNMIDGRALMTTIFDLSRKGYINIEEIESGKKKKRDFKFTKNEKPNINLLKHEIYLLNWIFDTIGDKLYVSTKDINNYRKKNLIKYNKEINLWQNQVKEAIKERGYYDNKGPKFGFILLIICALSFIIGILAVAFDAFYGILLIFASIFILIYSIALFYRKSDKGHIQYGMWKSFKKDIERQKKGTYNEYDIKIPKDKTLLYALALGLPMKSLDAIRKQASDVYVSSQWPYWYFLVNSRGGSSFEDSLNSSFYGGAGTSTSSSIGGGGGFSSGGGGGASGGGTGGF